MKILYTILVFIIFGIISGCGKETGQTVNFERFTMQIDKNYKVVDTSLVENKQIKDKVIKGFRISNKDGFDENLIIVKTDLSANTSIETFAQTNIEKLQKQTTKYSQIENKTLDFNCDGNTIKGIYNTYKVYENIDNNISKDYYFLQYYYILDNYGYVISFVSTSKTSLTNYINDIKSLTCKE